MAAGPVPIAVRRHGAGADLGDADAGRGEAALARASYRTLASRSASCLGQRFAAEVRSGLAVTDDLGRTYRLHPVTWGDAPGEPGRRRWRGEVLAEPQPGGIRDRPRGALAGVRGGGKPARSGRFACSRGGRDGSGRTGLADAGRGLPGGTGLGPVGDDRHRRGQRGARRREDRRRGGGRAAVDRGAAAGQRHALRPGGTGPAAGRRSWRSCGAGRRTCGRATASPNGPGWPLPCRCDGPPR